MILHIDMDAFYASIEERDRPELVGRPVIVGGTPQGRGVVAAANYVVRKFGVHSAMPTATALRLCPDAIVLPPRIGHYAEISEQIREVMLRYTPLVEPLSLDEAFLDVAGTEQLFGPAIEVARRIKYDIRRDTQLVASVGVAPNKFLAKIASDLEKPDALVVVDPDRIQQFLDPLPVGRIWGVGRVTGTALERIGVVTISDLRRLPVDTLRQHFGSQGDHFWKLAHGIDDRPVVADREAKSISHETTFPTDIHDREALRAWVFELTEHVGRRLRRHQLRGRTVQIKLRFSDFRTITRAVTLPTSTSSTHEIAQAAAGLLDSSLPQRAFAIRLLGVGVNQLVRPGREQQSLFGDPDVKKHEQLDATLDNLQSRFGSSAIQRGSGLLHNAQHRPEPRPENNKRSSEP